jgi:hypothetical protein
MKYYVVEIINNRLEYYIHYNGNNKGNIWMDLEHEDEYPIHAFNSYEEAKEYYDNSEDIYKASGTDKIINENELIAYLL